MPRTFAYVRVSISGQTTDNQLQEIQAAGFSIEPRRAVTETISGKGLLPPGKKAIVFLASGGAYAEGPAKAYDFVEPYLRAVLGFIGLTDVTVIRVESQANPGVAQEARAGAMHATHALAA